MDVCRLHLRAAIWLFLRTLPRAQGGLHSPSPIPDYGAFGVLRAAAAVGTIVKARL